MSCEKNFIPVKFGFFLFALIAYSEKSVPLKLVTERQADDRIWNPSPNAQPTSNTLPSNFEMGNIFLNYDNLCSSMNFLWT